MNFRRKSVDSIFDGGAEKMAEERRDEKVKREEGDASRSWHGGRPAATNCARLGAFALEKVKLSR